MTKASYLLAGLAPRHSSHKSWYKVPAIFSKALANTAAMKVLRANVDHT